MGNIDAMAIGSGIPSMVEARDEFSAREFGPTELRMIFECKRLSACSAAVRADSDIYTPYDIKGKRLTWYVGSPGRNLHLSATLYFANLTWDDVEKVEVSGYPAGPAALKMGTADVSYCDTMSTDAYELEASPAGLRYLPFPPDDVEAWERAKPVNPIYYPILCEHGAGLSAENPIWLRTIKYPTYVCHKDLPENVAYWLTKGIVECYEDYKDAAPGMEWWTLEGCIDTAPYVAWHPGTIRYFKEIGVWTDEMEEQQQELLEHQVRFQEAWATATEEADELTLSPTEWKEMWEEIRQQIPGASLSLKQLGAVE